MFWKTKKVVEVDGLPITLSKRQVFNRFTGAITSHFLAYKNGDEWIGLVSYEQFREEMDEIRKRQELILDHLKLKYFPETETKEPAKLVEKMGDNSFFDNLKHGAIVNVPNAGVSMPMPMSVPMSGGGGRCSTSGPTPTKPKKKGRPKKK